MTGRLERIRRQALSKMTVKQAASVEDARDRLSSALKEKNRAAEKSVSFKNIVEAPPKSTNAENLPESQTKSLLELTPSGPKVSAPPVVTRTESDILLALMY